MITASELRAIPLFAALPDSEAGALAARLADVRLREGDWLLQEGDTPAFYLVLDGALAVSKAVHGVERQLDVYRPGTYFGELPILLGAPAIASIRAVAPSRVAQLDTGDFHALFAECTTFAGELTRTMTTRFTRLQTLAATSAPATITLVGHRFDIACHRLRDFLAHNDVLHRWLDPTRPELAGDAPPPQAGDRYPVLVLTDGRRLVTPTLREVADALDLSTGPRAAAYDVAIVGAGPAGLAAAVYGASEGLATLLVERRRPAGRRAPPRASRTTSAFPPACPATSCRDARCGRCAASAPSSRWRAPRKRRAGGRGQRRARARARRRAARARAQPRRSRPAWPGRELDVPGRRRARRRRDLLRRRGTRPACTARPLVVVGGGNSAGQAAMFLANYASQVSLLVRGRRSRRACRTTSSSSSRAGEHRRSTGCRIVGVAGGGAWKRSPSTTGTAAGRTTRPTSAVFVFIGADAQPGGCRGGLDPRRGRVRAHGSRRDGPGRCGRAAGRSRATRTRSRRPCRASSRRATCATAR